MDNSTTSPPLVSIIVPVFNGERYLRESLDSILAQTYPNIEVLVMDDCSTDRTAEIVASYSPRAQSIRQTANRGIYGNANDGIARARGKYIAVYHADDVYLPTIVEREVDFLEKHPQAGAVFCLDIFIDPEGREEGRLHLVPEVRGGKPLDYPVVLNALLKYKNRFLMCPGAMVRASVYHDLGGYRDREFRNTSDLEMWLRIARKYPIGILEEHLFRYRFGHGNSAQRYHQTRTEPERYFQIMDLYLSMEEGRSATREALAGYEAHRNEDRLKRVINCYLQGNLPEARRILGEVRVRQILAGGAVERGRLFVLLLFLRAVSALPRIPAVADLLAWRWYGGGRRKRGSRG